MRRLLVVLAVVLAAAGCGDDGGGSPVTTVTVVLDDSLSVGETFEQGGVSLTVHGVEQAEGLVVADVEACLAPSTPPGLPIEAAAWQLRIEGRSEALTRAVLADPPPAARPAWPARVALDSGDCRRGRVPFEVDPGVVPRQVLFVQLGRPVAWRVG